jgi:glutathione S-transferase
MATLTLHSTPLSTYGRTCRMALAEKGVDYELDPVMPQVPEQVERQPWGSVPAMTHGDVRMYETLAICNYVEAAFDGPALQPADPLARARCYQWSSVFIQYLYRPGIDIVLQRLVVPSQGGEPDEGLIAESIPKTEKALGALDGALAGGRLFRAAAPHLSADDPRGRAAPCRNTKPDAMARRDGRPRERFQHGPDFRVASRFGGRAAALFRLIVESAMMIVVDRLRRLKSGRPLWPKCLLSCPSPSTNQGLGTAAPSLNPCRSGRVSSSIFVA